MCDLTDSEGEPMSFYRNAGVSCGARVLIVKIARKMRSNNSPSSKKCRRSSEKFTYENSSMNSDAKSIFGGFQPATIYKFPFETHYLLLFSVGKSPVIAAE